MQRPKVVRGIRRPTSATPAIPVREISPDSAWKSLSIVVDWIKHADSKAGVTIASAGVIAGVLFNILKDRHGLPIHTVLLATACGGFAVLGGACAAWALKPRLWSKEKPSSPIFFSHIARAHSKKVGSERYGAELLALIANNDELVREIASQVWANAHVARQKYQWGNIGLICVLLSLPFLTATATILLVL